MNSLLNRKTIFTTLYSLYFLVVLDWGIVAIIFTPLIVDQHGLMLPSTTTIASRNLILGFLLAAYPIAQLFGSIISGALADSYGRRFILQLGTLATGVGFALSACAVSLHSLSLLFITRALTGFAGGNMALTQVGVADITDSRERGVYMSVFPILGGLAWTVGPLIAAFLSNPMIVSWFGPATVLWFIAAAFVICFIAIHYAFKETYQVKNVSSIQFKQAFNKILIIFHLPQLFIPFMVFFALFFGWFLFIWLFPAYLIEKFHLTKIMISYIFADLSAGFMLGGILSNQWLLKKYKAESFIVAPFVVLAILLSVTIFLNNPKLLWFTLPVVAGLNAIASSALYTIHSQLAGEENQGKVFGSLYTMFAFCAAITPPIAGWLDGIWLELPTLIACILILCSGIFYHKCRVD